MDKSVTEEFVVNFFAELEKHRVTYCVLRNYQTLPNLNGHDIDVLLENSDRIFEKAESIINSLGWKIVYRIKEEFFRSLFCYYISDKRLEVVQLDLWTEEKWRGIKWIDAQAVLSSRKKYGFIYIPSKGCEAAITLLKEIIGKAYVKKVYYDLIQDYAAKDIKGFMNTLQPVFNDFTDEIYRRCVNGDFRYFDSNIKRIRRKLIFSKFPNIPIYIGETVKKVAKKIKQFIYPRGKLIVFVGPDGSGKTTLIDQQEKYLKPLFASLKKYHIRLNLFPELKTGYGFSSMRGKINQKQSVTSPENKDTTKIRRSLISILASWFVVGYYTLEFFIGKLILLNLKQNNSLILFDRYFYDHFTQPSTRDLIWPYRKLLLAFATKPDIVVHLKANPEIVYKRKQELSISEIESQNNYMARILKEKKNVTTVDTGIRGVDDISIEIFMSVISIINKD